MQKVVKWLHKGALVDAIFSASTEDGRLSAFTLLQVAAGFGQLEVVRELLERGASVDLPSGHGTTALMDAAIVTELLNLGANLPTELGQTALMSAAFHGHLSVLLVLLQHSANPSLQDIHGSTALMKAAHQGQEACVQALVRAKANTELLDRNSDTALLLAEAQGHTAIAMLMQQHAAPPPPAENRDEEEALYEGTANRIQELSALFEDFSAGVWTAASD